MTTTKQIKTSPTTATTPTLGEMIANREAEAIEAYNASKIARENARFAVADTEIEFGEAEIALEEIEDSFAALSDEFTVADHAEATSALRRAELRSTGAQAQARRAEGAVVAVDKVAAEVLAIVVRKALPGATVVSTFRDVGQNRPSPEEMPLALIIQSDPSILNKNGSISSSSPIKVRWWRGDLYANLSTDRLENAADELGIGMEIVGNGVTSQHGGTVEEVRIKLHEGVLGLPFLAQINERSLRNVGASVTSDIAAACRYHSETPLASRVSGAYSTTFVTVLNHEAKVVSEEIDASGERVIVIDLAVLVETHKEMQGRNTSEEIGKIIEALGEGVFFPGLGLSESLDRVSPHETTVPVEDREVRGLLALSKGDNPVDAIKVGYEATHAHFLRATLRSTTVTPLA